MRAVVQRVASAEVRSEGDDLGSIGEGLLVLLAVAETDTEADRAYLVRKVLNLRIFEDSEGKMNRSLLDVAGEMLVVSQFTLFGDCRRGNRPSFVEAAAPGRALEVYEAFVRDVRGAGVPVRTGRFQTMMDVALVNRGPVTILLDSRKTF